MHFTASKLPIALSIFFSKYSPVSANRLIFPICAGLVCFFIHPYVMILSSDLGISVHSLLIIKFHEIWILEKPGFECIHLGEYLSFKMLSACNKSSNETRHHTKLYIKASHEIAYVRNSKSKKILFQNGFFFFSKIRHIFWDKVAPIGMSACLYFICNDDTIIHFILLFSQIIFFAHVSNR